MAKKKSAPITDLVSLSQFSELTHVLGGGIAPRLDTEPDYTARIMLLNPLLI